MLTFQCYARATKCTVIIYDGNLVATTLGGERFFTDKEVSARLKVSRRTLQDYRNEGRIAYIQLGGKILYRESDIERMLNDGYRSAYRQRIT